MSRRAALPGWLASLGPVLGAAAALVHCDVPAGHQGRGAEVSSAEDCYACHGSDYEGAHNPFHPGVMPTTCADCHETDAWRPARFPEHPFPLIGAHQRALCSDGRCHGDPPVFQDEPDARRACVSCHQADYDRSPYPGHADFAVTCQDCHGQDAWRPAAGTADHSVFPLDGAHAWVECVGCHGDPPVYGGQPHECVGCHRDDYDRSPYPGHSAFATTCADCHTTSAWRPATGGSHPEDLFEISRGPHGEMECTECHDEALSGSWADNANCIGCHEHDQQHVDQQHADEGDYQWNGNDHDFCRECHPRGRH